MQNKFFRTFFLIIPIALSFSYAYGMEQEPTGRSGITQKLPESISKEVLWGSEKFEIEKKCFGNRREKLSSSKTFVHAETAIIRSPNSHSYVQEIILERGKIIQTFETELTHLQKLKKAYGGDVDQKTVEEHDQYLLGITFQAKYTEVTEIIKDVFSRCFSADGPIKPQGELYNLYILPHDPINIALFLSVFSRKDLIPEELIWSLLTRSEMDKVNDAIKWAHSNNPFGGLNFLLEPFGFNWKGPLGSNLESFKDLMNMQKK